MENYIPPSCDHQDNFLPWAQPLQDVALLGVAAYAAHAKSSVPPVIRYVHTSSRAIRF